VTGGNSCDAFSTEIGAETHLLANPQTHYIVKLIVGLGLYASCFPEVIKDGPPQDLKHPANHQYEHPVQIGVAKEVFSQGGTHESPVAHFRKGHFRVLRSEKFTHKRFQSIWIRDMIVKGKAVTVLSPEETEVQS